MHQTLKSCPKSNQLRNLVTLASPHPHPPNGRWTCKKWRHPPPPTFFKVNFLLFYTKMLFFDHRKLSNIVHKPAQDKLLKCYFWLVWLFSKYFLSAVAGPGQHLLCRSILLFFWIERYFVISFEMWVFSFDTLPSIDLCLHMNEWPECQQSRRENANNWMKPRSVDWNTVKQIEW